MKNLFEKFSLLYLEGFDKLLTNKELNYEIFNILLQIKRSFIVAHEHFKYKYSVSFIFNNAPLFNYFSTLDEANEFIMTYPKTKFEKILLKKIFQDCITYIENPDTSENCSL